jgi:hypothetical protein
VRATVCMCVISCECASLFMYMYMCVRECLCVCVCVCVCHINSMEVVILGPVKFFSYSFINSSFVFSMQYLGTDVLNSL